MTGWRRTSCWPATKASAERGRAPSRGGRRGGAGADGGRAGAGGGGGGEGGGRKRGGGGGKRRGGGGGKPGRGGGEGRGGVGGARGGGETMVHFQEWWVRLGAQVPATGFVFAGAAQASPAPGVLEAIAEADVILMPPSNPVVSIGTILAVPGIA